MKKDTKGPWPKSTIAYREGLFRVIKLLHFEENPTFYIQEATGPHLAHSWWDHPYHDSADLNEPFESLDAAIVFIRTIAKAGGKS